MRVENGYGQTGWNMKPIYIYIDSKQSKEVGHDVPPINSWAVPFSHHMGRRQTMLVRVISVLWDRNKCIASSNKCLTSSNKKLLEASASLLVTSALLVLWDAMLGSARLMSLACGVVADCSGATLE